MLEQSNAATDAPRVPGPTKGELTKAEQAELAEADRTLAAAEDQLTKARAEWAGLVRRLGVSKVARAVDLTTAAVSNRVKSWSQ